MSQILGVKFNDFGQIYYFSSGPFVVREGHSVIVKTEQGMGLGKVFVVQQDLPEDVTEDSIKTIYRLAGEEDVEAEAENKELARAAHKFCKNCIDQQKLEMKLVDVEVFFDRSKMIFILLLREELIFVSWLKISLKNTAPVLNYVRLVCVMKLRCSELSEIAVRFVVAAVLCVSLCLLPSGWQKSRISF